MYKNKFANRNNIAGLNIKKFRLQKNPYWSQNKLAIKLEVHGLIINKNAIQRMESGEGFITDIELKALSEVLGVTIDDLLDVSVLEETAAAPNEGASYPDSNSSYGLKQIAEKQD